MSLEVFLVPRQSCDNTQFLLLKVLKCSVIHCSYSYIFVFPTTTKRHRFGGKTSKFEFPPCICQLGELSEPQSISSFVKEEIFIKLNLYFNSKQVILANFLGKHQLTSAK